MSNDNNGRGKEDVSADRQPINKRERLSIDALISYKAHVEKVHEEVVRAMVEARFQADDIAKIKYAEYDNVIEFLVDLNLKHALN